MDVVMGSITGLLLSVLLVTSRQECAHWVLARVDGGEHWTPPLAGFVTGTGIFIAVASLWLLGGGTH